MIRLFRLPGLIAATLMGVVIVPRVAWATQPEQAVETWARSHAIRLRTVEPGSSADDLRAVKEIVGSARVVSLGEPAHGAHEALAFRNRLFRYLVEELGFTAIVLESGLAESRRIHDYVTGSPGDLAKVVSENLSWGFGGFRENADLVGWMLEYNADSAHQRKIRFYGMDLSLGGPSGSTPTAAPLDASLAYLDQVDSAEARRMRASLRPFRDRLPVGPAFTPAEHDSLTAVIEALNALLEQNREKYLRAGTEADYAWGTRNAIAAKQADRMFRVTPSPVSGGDIDPAAWRLVNVRDSALAANALWALSREGQDGRILVFAHNAHVMNAPITGGIWNAFEQPPRSMGMSLRSALGQDLVIMGSSGATNGEGLPAASTEAGSLEMIALRAGGPIFLLDLRTAPNNSGAGAWLREPRALRANFTTSLLMTPIPAFDVMLFLDRLTPAHTGPRAGP